MKSTKCTVLTALLLYSGSSFSTVMRLEDDGFGGSADFVTTGSYTCNIISERSTDEVAMLKRFRQFAVSNTDKQIFSLLIGLDVKTKGANSEFDPRLYSDSIKETLELARKIRVSANQDEAFVSEFINPGSAENCTRLTGIMNRINYYQSLLASN